MPVPRTAAPSISEPTSPPAPASCGPSRSSSGPVSAPPKRPRRWSELAERSGAKVFCSPRAKGIFPENHPNYLGVTGLGGHEPVTDYMVQDKPSWALVLGTRLGEPTSFWDRDLLPREGFLHVDIDPDVPGTLVPRLPHHRHPGRDRQLPRRPSASTSPRSRSARARLRGSKVRTSKTPSRLAPTDRTPVRPQAVMDALQRYVVDKSDAAGARRVRQLLRLVQPLTCASPPGRYRVSTLFGSMGHAAAGVVGARWRAAARRSRWSATAPC